VTSIVDPGLLTHGRDVLRGIIKDPKNGDMIIGVENALRHFTPFLGMSLSNDDSLRLITPQGVVSRLTSFPFPNDMVYNPADGMLYVATGAIHCHQSLGGYEINGKCPGTNGIEVVDPVSGDHHDFAGGVAGYAEGTGTQAQFAGVGGITLDPDNGDFYVADTANMRVRMVTAAGVVTTIAGSGTEGSSDGTGTAAQFAWPHAIAYCAKDKALYVADTDNDEIRKVTTDGVVTTIAGTPQAGYADGSGTNARFDHPAGIACATDGTLYVADTRNNTIRQIDANGAVTTLAGSQQEGTLNGVGSAARFSKPTDVWYDASDGSLYVVDQGSNNVRKVTTATR
jgi:sugar lactone lactonase YvrE